MTDRISPEHRSWNMSRIRGKDTKPEKRLRTLLHRAGYRFRLHDRSLPGSPDLVLPKYQTVVFVHGCYWHRHENCPKATVPKTRTEFWTSKFEGTIERDNRKEAELESKGWNVIKVWECDLEERPDRVLTSVVRQLKEASHAP